MNIVNIDTKTKKVNIDFGRNTEEKNQDAAEAFSNNGINDKTKAKGLVEKLKKTSLAKKGLQDIKEKTYEVTISDAKIETVKS